MEEDIQVNIQNRKDAVQKEFDALSMEERNLVAQGQTLEKKLHQLRTRLTQLQGSNQELDLLLKVAAAQKVAPKENPKDVPAETPETPKEEPSKK